MFQGLLEFVFRVICLSFIRGIGDLDGFRESQFEKVEQFVS